MNEPPDDFRTLVETDGTDAATERDSRLIYQALRERRGDLQGEAALPQDQALSERILAEARNRSAEISASRGGSGHRAQRGARGIPWWMILAWLAAITAVVLAFRYLV